MFWFLAILAFFASPALALETQSFTATVGTSYTLVANFDGLALKYSGLQIQNPDAVAVDCAKSAAASSPTLRLATGFTSVTLDAVKPTGSLYCKVAADSHQIVVNVWAVP